ncbi:S41 family peptidase [Litoribacter populi]|uniref:S41 family peptidase n=1 Tax=Litoribacter populi TaxID=2598460 RepID=UPI00117FE253|nr:S41 family peptidase [Litoribacter populi]
MICLSNRFGHFFGMMLIFCLLPVLILAQDDKKRTQKHFSSVNRMLCPKEMKEDLQAFVKIREEVNSGLYVYRTKEEMDSMFNWAFKEVSQPMEVTDFFKIILKLTDFEGSLHNYTEPGTDFLTFVKEQQTFFPYHLTYIEGMMIFDGHHETIPPGSRILSINGAEDKELMQSFYKFFPVDGFNTSYKLSSSVDKAFAWRYIMEYGLTEEFQVEFTSPFSETVQRAILPAVDFAQQEKNIQNKYSAPVSDLLDYKKQAPYSYEKVNSETGLLNLRWFGFATSKEDPAFEVYTDFIDSVFTVLDRESIPNLVIDVRNNPGGSDPTFEQPIMYLSDSTFKENLEAHIIFDPKEIPFQKYFWGVSTDERIDGATLAMGMEFLGDYFIEFSEGKSFQNQKYNPVYHPKSPAYKGNIYLLINENTASAASHFASLMKAYARNLTIVGVETVGGYYVHNGHIGLVYELPNSQIKSKFSVVYVVHDAPVKPDQPTGRGIIPDHEVWQTLKDFLQHKDTQMEFVLKTTSSLPTP